MRTTILFTTILVLLFSACKKDTANPNGVINFTLQGTSKSFSIYTNSLADLDTMNIQEKTLVLASAGVVAGPALNTGVGLVVEQNLTLPGSSFLATGAYRDAAFNTNCTGTGIYPAGCSAFYFSYYDPVLGNLSPSATDSAGYLYITSFSNSPNLVSGNFSCQMSDGHGNLYAVTNGSLTNVPFTNQ